MLVTSRQPAIIQLVPTNATVIQVGRERALNVPTLTSVRHLPAPTVGNAKSSRMARTLPAFATARGIKVNYATKILMNARLIMEDATLSLSAPTRLEAARVDLARVVTQVLVMPTA